MSQTAKHIIFIGRVQSVGFRFTAYNMANRHQITGFVRNLLDGNVEMLAQGPSDAVDACIRDIQASFAGYIIETKIRDVTFDTHYKEFKITF